MQAAKSGTIKPSTTTLAVKVSINHRRIRADRISLEEHEMNKELRSLFARALRGEVANLLARDASREALLTWFRRLTLARPAGKLPA